MACWVLETPDDLHSPRTVCAEWLLFPAGGRGEVGAGCGCVKGDVRWG